MKLNQVVAVLQGKKTRGMALLTEAHRSWKPEGLMGLARVYEPKAEDGDKLPPEGRLVTARVKEVVRKVCEELVGFWDVVHTQESGNQEAAADIVLDNTALVRNVPVGMLLFLGKQLEDLGTFCKALPVLPADRDWAWDPNRNCYTTEPTRQNRTQKVPKTHVKFEPTEHHPGQADIVTVDEPVGTWETTHFSGAIPAQQKEAIVRRVCELQDAVKKAREAANMLEVEQKQVAKTILDYVFQESAV